MVDAASPSAGSGVSHSGLMEAAEAALKGAVAEPELTALSAGALCLGW